MKLKLILLNLFCALMILILCSIPGDDLPKTPAIQIPYFDKIAHFFMFFFMALFLTFSLHVLSNLTHRKIVLLSLLFTAIYGGLIEYLQQVFFVNRSGDCFDFMADVLGGLVAVFVFVLNKKRIKRSNFCG